MTRTRELSVAVIGAGMAGRSHAAGYRQANTVFGPGLPPIRLAAVADANLPLAQDAARRYGYEKALASWEEVVEDPAIDAVSVVVGNHLHRPIVEALIDAGKHVLCEKPLAGSLADARAMVSAERRADVVTAVGYTFRRSPAIAAIERHVREGALGELSLFHGRYWCDYGCAPRSPLAWRYLGAPGTGALADIGAHLIDVAQLLCGPIEAVSGAVVTTQITERPRPLGPVVGHQDAPASEEVGQVENEDTAAFSVHFASGLAGSLSVSRTAFGMPNGLAFDLYGLDGHAGFDVQRPAEYLFDDRAPDARTRGPRQVIIGPQAPYFAGGYPMAAAGVGGGNAEMFVYQCRAFLEQIVAMPEPLPPNATFADGLQTLEVIAAVVESARSGGGAVAVPAP